MKLKKLKILHIITQLELGGAQRNALDSITLLDKSRYDVYLVSSDKGILVKDALDIAGVRVLLISSLKRAIAPFDDLMTLLRLAWFFRKEAIDLVHTHSSKAGILGRWAARFAGVPIIVHTVHGWSFHPRQNFLAKSLYPFLERITAAFTDRLIAVSESDIRKGLQKGIGRKEKYALIRYGIRKERFINCELDLNHKKEQLGLSLSAPVVGMISCFKPQKCPQDFIRAAVLIKKAHPGTRFLLVGDGVLRGNLQRLIETLNLGKDFILTGWRRDIAELMSCMDVLVLSSLWEGVPIVFLEAMSRKLPIVAYDVDGVGEVVRNGVNGFLVAPGNIAALAEHINQLLEDKELLNAIGRRGFDVMLKDDYSAERMLNDLDRLYSALVSGKGN